mmetsp:Transcript_8511/g.35009  ORF Transcript_8511/g.35009 Transcript_8511/m.35009 type:complete len:932 (+) Transcript_8511:189-2984(+)
MEGVGGFLPALCRCGKPQTACSTHPSRGDASRVLLPSHSYPVAYDLKLKVRLDDHAFDGVVEIRIAVTSATASLTLHAKDLTFGVASIDGVDVVSTKVDDDATTVTFEASKILLPGREARLRVEYRGVLNNAMCGFYRSTYTNLRGEPKLMASTQFESIDARRCFPCWDEPLRKATFKTALTVPAHLTALSNMPEERVHSHYDEASAPWKTVEFMESPRMSTYLLAFCVGEFDVVAMLTQNKVMVRVFTPPGKPELGTFALKCAVAALDKYDETFDLPYPLPKSDMVAIPEFAAGAMENWGLVTYREVDLLVDETAASSRQLQRIAEVVIHELAHQWFGNLVTMEWWDDLWLNEGFATWMETGVLDELRPEWRLWTQFVADFQGKALVLDALESSHPVQVPIRNAEEVEQVFDHISYCKGGSVVRMAHAVLGQADFVAGLRAYMKDFAYGNATTDDLWSAWERASSAKRPVREIMAQWTTQTGFPLLELVLDDDDDTVTLTQRRFLADGSSSSASSSEPASLWTIPVFARSEADDTERLVALFPPKASTTLAKTSLFGDDAAASWVKLNAGQFVPLRVKYPRRMIPALAQAVRDHKMPEEDRVGLLSDAAALAKAGVVDATALLEILGAFAAEQSETVAAVVVAVCLAVSKALMPEDDAETTDESARLRLKRAFDAFAKTLVAPHLGALGWDPRATDAHLSRKLRGEVIAAVSAFFFDDAAVREEARTRYDAFKADAATERLPAEYRAAVFELVLGTSDAPDDTVAELAALYGTLELNDDKKSVLKGLGAGAPTTETRRAVLDFALSDAVKLQDFFYVALAMQASPRPAARGDAWRHFTDRFDAYNAKCGEAGSSIMDAALTGAFGGVASLDRADEIAAFFEAHPLPRNVRKIAQTLEDVRTTAKFVAALLAPDSGALAWLEHYNNNNNMP